MEHEVLGGADVEGERGRVGASEQHARAVGRDGERLGAVAAIDLGGIVAVAALEQVAAVARVPDHAVVAGLAEHLVVAGAAGQHVVAVAAEQQVVAALAEQDVVAVLAEQLILARTAGERVVAGAAEQLSGGQRAVGFVQRDRVVAALAEPLDQGGVGDRGRAADDGNGAAVDEKVPGRVAAERDRVLAVVADRRQHAVGVEIARDSHCRRPFVCVGWNLARVEAGMARGHIVDVSVGFRGTGEWQR